MGASDVEPPLPLGAMPMTGTVVGYDPGGNCKHGLARATVRDGDIVCVTTKTLPTVEDVVASILDIEPLGVRNSALASLPAQPISGAGHSAVIKQIEHLTQADLRPLLRKSLKDVRADLKTEDRHIRGLALEALAFKLMRLIDLTYVRPLQSGPCDARAGLRAEWKGWLPARS